MPDRKKRITAFGEILWDVYPDSKRLGGAPFNFIYHIWKITGNTNFISAVGNDNYGKEIVSYLNSINFITNNLIVDEEHPTGKVIVELDENKAPRFTPTYNCCFDFIKLSDESIQKIFAETELLYFGTFSARCQTTRNTLISLLNNPQLKYFCDLNLRHNLYSRELVEKSLNTSNVIKINEYELGKLKEMFDITGDDKEACYTLINKFGIDIIGLTLGENGAYLFGKNEYNYFRSEQAEIVDTLGAGDAFAAILCLGYLDKMPLQEINRMANEFAIEICKVFGAIPNDSVYKKYIASFNK